LCHHAGRRARPLADSTYETVFSSKAEKVAPAVSQHASVTDLLKSAEPLAAAPANDSTGMPSIPHGHVKPTAERGRKLKPIKKPKPTDTTHSEPGLAGTVQTVLSATTLDTSQSVEDVLKQMESQLRQQQASSQNT